MTHDEIALIRAALIDQADEVARALLGPENRHASNRRELRWNRKGSLAVTLRGRWRGRWRDHEGMEGGDLLVLIRRETGGDFADAVAWARSFLGWPVDGPVPSIIARPSPPARNDEVDADEAAGISRAREIWASCGPVEDTLAAQYLNSRGVHRPASGWPASIGFHPRRKALVVAVTDDDGDVVAVQAIHLDADGRKAKATSTRPTKQSNGPVRKGALRLPGATHAPLLVAEGPETALSVWVATGLETWAALGSLGNLTPPIDRDVILLRDDDKRWSPADRKARETVKAWQEQGRRVAVAWPWDIRRGDKTDFNDTIKESGPAGVVKRIEAARAFLTGNAPVTTHRMTLTAARETLDREVRIFFDMALSGFPASSQALHVDLGTGKTEAALRHAVQTLARMRKTGDDRCIVVAVPEHRLGRQVVERFNRMAAEEGLDLTAGAWRGREALDPDRTDGGKMCGNLDRVKEAQAVLLDPEKTVCATCPLASECSYLAQKRTAADLWVVGHRLLFGRKPAALPDVAALVIDESPWTAALIGVDGKPLTFPLDALTDTNIPVPTGDEISGDGARLTSLRATFAEALAAAPDGPVKREHLAQFGIDDESGRIGAELEWKRLCKDGDLSPNRNLRRFAAAWQAVEALMHATGPYASGWLEIGRDDERGRILILRGRKPPGDAWRVPTLFLDASLDADLLRPIWGDVQTREPILVEKPHQRLTQIVDRTFSKTAIAPADEIRDPAEAKRRARNLRDLHADIYAQARAAEGRALIIGNLDVVDALRGMRWPAGTDFAHFNATAGRDDWGDVRLLVVIGRPMPAPGSVERMAEAMTGRAGKRIKGFYPATDATRTTRDGSTVQAERVTHPDATAARILDRIVAGEIAQAIGRGRGVNRTAETPLDVVVYGGDAILDDVDALRSWQRPDPDALMMAAGGVAFENSTDAATAYPELWPSPAAAKKALARCERSGTFPYRDILLGECPPPRTLVRYQRPGPGQRPALAYVDVDLNPRLALDALVGAVTFLPLDDGNPETFQRGTVGKVAVSVVSPPAAVNDVAPVVTPAVELDPVEHFRISGGIIPLVLRPQLRRVQREAGMRQSGIAARIGISRPQLANGLQGRFGLSPEPAARLVALIERPPEPRAPLML